MVKVYQPRPEEPSLQLHLEQIGSDASLWIVDGNGKWESTIAVVGDGGLERCGYNSSGDAELAGIPLDDYGCIALHPDDPAMRTIAELEARVKELEAAPTVAPELTDKQCEKLWRVFVDDPSSELDSLRVMFAAYEAMRRPITDEDVERAAKAGYEARWGHRGLWEKQDDRLREQVREGVRAALETMR
ncbi:MAG: hypothetical protein VYB54_04840 [Pseudomonadota bacterium]|nr:hypothetical protein [Pseudomonadota bacterium]